ncbi:hypothetical protein ACLB2K_040338 [Fragaria x ananassa]
MAGNCLEVVELTSSGRPVLLSSEIECSLLSAVDLECEELPNFPNLKSGILTLTTHRLLWLPDSSSQGASSAIPLASITHIFSAKKSLKSMFASPRFRFQLSVSPDGRVSSSGSGSGSRSIVVTVVVRGKGADLDVFLTKFWDNWRGRAWETGNADVTSGSVSGSGSTSSGLYTKEGTVRMVGVSGILRKEQEMWETTDKSLQDAFQDLNALMSKAKEMVLLAEKMRQKLLSGSTSQPSAAEDEELGSKQEMQDWLLSVGIISPVTKESAGALYHQQLSREPLLRCGQPAQDILAAVGFDWALRSVSVNLRAAAPVRPTSARYTRGGVFRLGPSICVGEFKSARRLPAFSTLPLLFSLSSGSCKTWNFQALCDDIGLLIDDLQKLIHFLFFVFNYLHIVVDSHLCFITQTSPSLSLVVRSILGRVLFCIEEEKEV